MQGAAGSDARKRYMRDVYSEYWASAREEKYGFLAYDRSLCDQLVAQVAPGSRMLEVAVGTGFPFADFFEQAGFDVHGVDISRNLVADCRARNPRVAAVAGDAERLPYDAAAFPAVYCFHSTWYFPNLQAVIEEMFRVVSARGLVAFDIQNRDHPAIRAVYERALAETRGARRLARYARNVGKIILRQGPPVWGAITPETPTDPREVVTLLGRLAARWEVFVRRPDGSLERRDLAASWADAERLVFLARAR